MQKKIDKVEGAFKSAHRDRDASAPGGFSGRVMEAVREVSEPHLTIESPAAWEGLWRVARVAAAAAIAILIAGYLYFEQGGGMLGLVSEDPVGLTAFMSTM